MKRFAVALVALLLASASIAYADETRVSVYPGLGYAEFSIPVEDPECPHEEGATCSYTLWVEAPGQGTVYWKTGSGILGEASMNLESCKLDGKTLAWNVELTSKIDASWKREEQGTFYVEVAGCDERLPHLRAFRTSRKEARQAVLRRLYPMFVSHLVCKRHGRGFYCKTTFNDTVSECRAVFRAVRMGWVGGSQPNRYFVSVGLVKKRCHAF
jgi:hypothetical protein